MAAILVVDDDMAQRDLERRMLLVAGHMVHAVADGAQAMAELEQASYDLLITDIYMPVMDGMALLAHCRQHHPQLALLAITGGDVIADERKLAAAGLLGSVELLHKPYAVEAFRAAIARALSIA